MARGPKRRKRGLMPKCNRCVVGHSTRIWYQDRTWVYVSCAICRNEMTALEQMRPTLALVKP